MKSILFALPTSLFLAISVSGDLLARNGMYWDGYWNAFFTVLAVSAVLISIPIALAQHSKTKNKGWIIALSVLCFLPLGVVLYLVSLVWALAVYFVPVNMNTRRAKVEIVNNTKYKNLKKTDRIDWLKNMKGDAAVRLEKCQHDLMSECKKVQDIPVDVAKYINQDNIGTLKKEIGELETKIAAIDELIAAETFVTKPKRNIFDDEEYED